jgi:hypothetical protein
MIKAIVKRTTKNIRIGGLVKKGDKGDTGLQGNTGIQGTHGDTGLQGNTGIQGLKGDTGIQGIKGDTGTTGLQGSKGDTGNKGDTGTQGLQGDQGDTGFQGDTGLQGLQGVKGNTGNTGSKGDTGNEGAPGIKGDTGTTGSQGVKGDTGSTGTQGVKGDTGTNGAKGDTGTAGAKGDTGNSGTKGDTGFKGDTGVKGDTGIQGTKGDTGSAGAQGEQGDTGATGSAGQKGDTGSKGDTGVSGTAGAKGDTGVQGVKGDTGTTGAQGVQGDTGTAGNKGDTGAGTKGDTGVGVKGDTGTAGVKGDTGEGTGSVANESIKLYERGVALSGLEFSASTLPGTEGTNYFQPLEADVAYYASKGFTLIRLPFIWERIQPTLNGALDSTYKGYIDNAIDLARKYKMKIVLDLHNYGRYTISGVEHIIGDGTLTTAHLADLWSRLATSYVDEDVVFAYDLMNEPHDMTVATTSSNYNTTATWTLAAQAAIDAIRLVDTKHWILLETDNWAGLASFTSSYGSNPDVWWDDPSNRTMLSCHYYQDSDHSGQYSGSWSSTLRNNIPTEVLPALIWARNNNLKVYIGEYGVPNGTSSDALNWQADLDTVLSYFDAFGAFSSHWAAGHYYNSITTLQPLVGGVSDYDIEVEQMPILQKHLGYAPARDVLPGGGDSNLQFNDNGKFEGADQLYWDKTNHRLGIGVDTPGEKVDIAGNFQVKDSATSVSKAYRFRTTGGALDLEAGGADLYLSTWTGAGFTGTQRNQFTFHTNGDPIEAARDITVPDEAYGAGWNGSLEVPTKNALYDKIETLGTGLQGDTGVAGAQGDTGTAGSNGSKGDTGVKGDTGTAGSNGAKGDTGTSGAKGDTGVGVRYYSKTVGFADADYIVDGTDDHVQIQAAIDAVDAAGGGTVFIQAGTYNAATITVKNTVSLQGEGRETKIVGKTNAAPDLIISENFASEVTTGDAFGGIAHGFIDGFLLESGSQTASGETTLANARAMNAVLKLYAWDFRLSNIRIDYSSEIAIYTEHDDDWTDDGTFNTYELGENNYHNIKIKNYSFAGWVNRGSHDSHFQGVYISSSDDSFLTADYGLVIQSNSTDSYGAHGAVLHNVHVWGNHTQNAVYIDGANVIDGFIYAEGSDVSAIKINASSANRFKAFLGFAVAGIELAGASNGNNIEAVVESNLTGPLFQLNTSASNNILTHGGGYGSPGGAVFDLSTGGTYTGTGNTFVKWKGYGGTQFNGTPAAGDLTLPTPGVKGDTGTTGSTGAKGDTGTTGAKGDTGTAGSNGAKGDTGTAGSKGDTGATGTSISITEAPSDLTGTGIIATFTYGESLTPGDAVYYKSDGKVYKADADGVSTYPCIGLALETASSGSHTVLLGGIYRDDTRFNWTVGGVIYLSTTAGGLTQTQPSATDNVIQVIGIATHADRMYVNPSLDYITHT